MSPTRNNVYSPPLDGSSDERLIAVTDEGEIARSVASYLDEEVIVATSPDVVLRERPRAVIHTFEVEGDERSMWNVNVWFAINIARAANRWGQSTSSSRATWSSTAGRVTTRRPPSPGP
jgi:hypothetical protein